MGTVRRNLQEPGFLALDFALRSEGIPVYGLLQYLAARLQGQSGAEGPATEPKEPTMVVSGDDEAGSNITLKKRFMALRHVL